MRVSEGKKRQVGDESEMHVVIEVVVLTAVSNGNDEQGV